MFGSRLTRHTLAHAAGCWLLACGGDAASSAEHDGGDDVSVPTLVQCDIVGSVINQSPYEKEELVGTNGTFVDHCEEGNLVNHMCEQTVVGEGENSYPTNSGAVVSFPVDCGGRCQDGACPNLCPRDGDVIRYESAGPDGSMHTLIRPDDGRRYECHYVADRSARDCASFEPGTELVVIRYSGAGCTMQVDGALGLGDESGLQLCGYDRCALLSG